MRILLLLVIISAISSFARSQAVYTPTDIALYKNAVAALQKQPQHEQGSFIVDAGKCFLGTKYEAHTLDQSNEEQLVIHLEGQDCTTFLENILALTATLKQPSGSFEQFAQNLQYIRYRGGLIENYSSRLHYFSDWLYENQERGNIQLVTRQIGGKPFVKTINFMSTHRSSYPALTNEAYYRAIQQAEKAINERTYYYIPKAEVSKTEKQIQPGDIIAITTDIKGLDIVHVGFAVIQNGRVHLLHASSEEKKVVISAKPLADYLLGNKNQSGIMVARIISY